MNLIVLTFVFLFIVLQLADIGTTLAILRQGGHERNLVVKAVMDKLGRITGLLVVKLVAIAFVLFAAKTGAFNGYGLIVLLALVAGYVFVVYRNVLVLR